MEGLGPALILLGREQAGPGVEQLVGVGPLPGEHRQEADRRPAQAVEQLAPDPRLLPGEGAWAYANGGGALMRCNRASALRVPTDA